MILVHLYSKDHKGQIDLFRFVGRVCKFLVKEGAVREGRVIEFNRILSCSFDFDCVFFIGGWGSRNRSKLLIVLRGLALPLFIYAGSHQSTDYDDYIFDLI